MLDDGVATLTCADKEMEREVWTAAEVPKVQGNGGVCPFASVSQLELG